jgi:hypothetical protein
VERFREHLRERHRVSRVDLFSVALELGSVRQLLILC